MNKRTFPPSCRCLRASWKDASHVPDPCGNYEPDGRKDGPCAVCAHDDACHLKAMDHVQEEIKKLGTG